MRRTTRWALAGVAAFGWPLAAIAEEAAPTEASRGEEIVVTGSYIKGTPEDAALPVDVTDAQDLEELGNPSLIETIRNLAYTSGNLAESNQFGSSGGSAQGAEGITNINLRGLGGARTLVLLNGHRQVPSETQGVDVDVLPSTAIGRIEVLKDGAAATYGSDAIAGVVNMITREGFEGFEVRGSEQFIEDSDGDHEVSMIWGSGSDTVNYFIAGEWRHRSELRFRDRDWGIRPFADNPQGGFSAIANPGQIFPTSPTGTLLAAATPDPGCADVAVVGFGQCRFQYTQFDNLTEEQDNYKLYGEVNVDLFDGAEWHTEAFVTHMDMTNRFKTSPSYPPQSLFGPDRFIPATHPALVDLKARFPGFFIDRFGIPAAAQGAFVQGRMIGVEGDSGEPREGTRQTKQYRFATALTGEFGGSVSYDFGVSFSERQRYTSGYDMFTERMAFAIDGLGGPDCDQATGTPGVGPCMFFNPFSTAIRHSVQNGADNPNFVPALDNPPSLTNWMVGELESDARNKLLVLDAVLSGETPFDLGAGAIGWAFGVQTRNEHYDLDLNSLTNLEETPCQFNNPRSVTLGNVSAANFNNCLAGTSTGVTGPFAFLAGTVEETTSRTIYAAFSEFAVPVTDTLDLQLAIRYEDYGGDVGNTIDPKVAFKWQVLDWLAVRGSAGSTFRGPPQSFLSGRGTALVFIGPAAAFKAVDTLGNPDLKPESADTTNVGLIFETGGLYATIDYWAYDFTDPFQTESSGQITAAYIANGCQNGGAGAPLVGGVPQPTPDCAILRTHVFPTGTPAAALERVEVNIINGSDIQTSGIDAYVQYTFDELFGGEFTVGFQGTHTIEYDSEDFKDINGLTLAEGGDFVGFLNDLTAPFTPKPDLKGDVFAKYTSGIHTGTLVMRYVTDYEDAAPPGAVPGGCGPTPNSTCLNLDQIDDQTTFDAHYIVRLMNDSLVLSFSAINFTDEDPPLAATDLNYDPFTHDPRGRTFKLGFTYTMGNQ